MAIPNRKTNTVIAFKASTATQEFPIEASVETLIPELYNQLRRVARNQIRSQLGAQTLSPTELVHEVFMKLQKKEGRTKWDQSHFFAVASQCMRWILADYARTKHRSKRGGKQIRVELCENLFGTEGHLVDLAILTQTFEALKKQDERLCRVAELRFLLGLNISETAKTLGISPATVKRDTLLARAWLNRELKASQDENEEQR